MSMKTDICHWRMEESADHRKTCRKAASSTEGLIEAVKHAFVMKLMWDREEERKA